MVTHSTRLFLVDFLDDESVGGFFFLVGLVSLVVVLTAICILSWSEATCLPGHEVMYLIDELFDFVSQKIIWTSRLEM